jgi:hypothetical protein
MGAGLWGVALSNSESQEAMRNFLSTHYYDAFNVFCMKGQKDLIELGGIKLVLGYALKKLGMAKYLNSNKKEVYSRNK